MADLEDEETKTLLEKLKEIGQSFIGTDIKWNFTNFLLDKEGNVIDRFSTTFKPHNLDLKIAGLIAK